MTAVMEDWNAILMVISTFASLTILAPLCIRMCRWALKCDFRFERKSDWTSGYERGYNDGYKKGYKEGLNEVIVTTGKEKE